MFLAWGALGFAQNMSINADGSAPDNSAMLDVSSTTQGLLIPRMTQAQRQTISSPAFGLMVLQTDNNKGLYIYDTTGSGAWTYMLDSTSVAALIAASAITEDSTRLADSDNDTKIQVEESNDEDLIRFDIEGNERMKLDSNTLHLGDGEDNVFIGNNAGVGNTTGSENIAIGFEAANGNQTGTSNTAIGYQSLKSSTGSQNTGLGKAALRDNTSGIDNTALGFDALRENESGSGNVAIGANAGTAVNGNANVIIGSAAGNNLSSGDANILIGADAGKNNSGGSANMFIGTQAGINESGSGLLYIENSDTVKPLIWGDFVNDSIRIYGALGIDDAFTFPTTDGSDGQVLRTDGSGNVTWDTPTLTNLEDDDNDTKIQVEESNDEDLIRFDIAGTEVMRLGSLGQLQIFNANTSTMIGNAAGSSLSSGSQNTFLGYEAGSNVSNTSNSTYLGYNAGKTANGAGNTAVGSLSGDAITSGTNNTMMGLQSGSATNTGNDNVFIGQNAGRVNSSGGHNTFIGTAAGDANNGDHNIFIGFNAGASESSASDKLIIENSSSTTPLIWGDFDADSLVFNGLVTIDDGSGSAFTLPGLDGSNGQVLQTDGSGNVTWESISGTTGSGESGFLAKWSSSTELDTSLIQESDSAVAIGTTPSSVRQLYVSTNESSMSIAIQGEHTLNSSTTTYGVFGTSASTDNANAAGVYGLASNGAYAVYGQQQSSASNTVAVNGYNSAGGSNQNYGVKGQTSSSNASSAGLYGFAFHGGNALLAQSNARVIEAEAYGARTSGFNAVEINNEATSSSSAISKVGLNIQSTGTWDGTGAENVGLLINVSGGTTNYAGLFTGGNVGIGTSSPGELLDVEGKALIDTLNIHGVFTFPSTDGSNGQVLRTDGSGTVDWATMADVDSVRVIRDGDDDTKIQVEESDDEDIIRFDVGGAEYFRMRAGKLEIVNTGQSVIIGDSAGANDNLGGNSNSFLGYKAGKSVTGEENVFVGWQAGENATSDYNVGIGGEALRSVGTGDQNVAVGDWAMRLSTGAQNVAVGAEALLENDGNGNVALGFGALMNSGGASSGAFNVAIGNLAGADVDGSNNVFIGKFAGQGAGNISNQLYIHNASGLDPLIWGDFSADSVRIHRILEISGGTDGDAQLALIADTDNSEETDNPSILFSQDGGSNTGFIGLEGDAGSSASETTDNALVIGTPVDEDVHFFSNGITRMTIEGGGTVGIGTSEPSGDFQLTDSTGAADLRITAESAGQTSNLYLTNTLHEYRIVNDVDGKLRFQDETAGTSRMVIDSVGNVGVGTLSPNALFHVEGGIGRIDTLSVAGNFTLPSTDGANGQVLQTDGGGNVSWADLSLSALSDGDMDTRIQVEESTNDNHIRFDIQGTEYFVMDTGRLEFMNTGSSIFIGQNAGLNDDFSNNENVYIGENSGVSGTTATRNIAIGGYTMNSATTSDNNTAVGYNALNNSTGSTLTGIGSNALAASGSAIQSTAVGYNAGQQAEGNANTIMGYAALRTNSSGNNNVAIGFAAGENSSGDNNVFIGYNAGLSATGGNKLYIDNSSTSTPLIYGDFANDSVKIYGTLGVGDAFAFPTSDGSSGQVLQTNGSGVLTWATGTGFFTQDNDTISGGTGSEKFVFGSTNTDDISGTADDYRMFFDKTTGAFRGGESTGDNWNADSLGLGSFAYGKDVKALGNYSIAIGDGVTVNGNRSIVMGRNSISNGGGSIVLGASSFTNTGHSVALGQTDTAMGTHSIAIGGNAYSGADYTIALGHDVRSEKQGAIAIGDEAYAEGTESVAIGQDIYAQSMGEIVLGFRNDTLTTGAFDPDSREDTDRLLVIGNSTNSVDRRNSLEMLKNGNTTLYGQLTLSAWGSTGFTLPNSDGSADQFLRTNGSGTVSWQSIQDIEASLMDTAGAHFMTTNLVTDTNWISGDGDPEGLYVDFDGEVGIGTKTPESELHVNGSGTSSTLRLTSTSTASLGLWMQTNSAQGGIINYENTPLNFGTNGATRMTIDETGNVGVGETSPSSKLDVAGDMEMSSSNAFYFGDPNTDGSWRIMRDGNNLLFQRRESGTWNDKTSINP